MKKFPGKVKQMYKDGDTVIYIKQFESQFALRVASTLSKQ